MLLDCEWTWVESYAENGPARKHSSPKFAHREREKSGDDAIDGDGRISVVEELVETLEITRQEGSRDG